MNDLFIGQGTFYYRPARKEQRMWHKEHGKIYSKSSAQRALKRLNDPEIKMKKIQ
jgi:hypothetical protein